jgi:hypothetical protein
VQLARHAPALPDHGRVDGPPVTERGRVCEEKHQGDEQKGLDDPVERLEACLQGQRADDEQSDARADEDEPARPRSDQSVPVRARRAVCAYGQFRPRRASATV